jgi:hypothetical protein
MCREVERFTDALEEAGKSFEGLSKTLSKIKWRYRVYFRFDDLIHGIFNSIFGSEENWKWMSMK